MDALDRAARLVAVLLLAQTGAFATMNIAFLKPVFAAPGYLQNGAAQATGMGLAAVFGLLAGLIGVALAVATQPLVRRDGDGLGRWLLAFAVAALAVTAVEQVHLLSMLQLSKAWAAAAPADQASYELLRGVVAAPRNFAHYLGLLMTAALSFTLYLGLLRGRIVPPLLGAAGMAASLSQAYAVGLPIFGAKVDFNFIYPLAVVHLVLIGWLLVKGASRRAAATA